MRYIAPSLVELDQTAGVVDGQGKLKAFSAEACVSEKGVMDLFLLCAH